jgi:DNA-binding NarL/FixJ family response regulator
MVDHIFYSMKMSKIRLFLVDDHEVVRDGIKALLSEFEDVVITGESDTAERAIHLIKQSNPDIVLLDIGLKDVSGLELCQQLSRDMPHIKVIMLTMYNTEEYIFNAIKSGAVGYLPKTISRAELIDAIRKVMSGEEFFASSISSIILKSYIRQVHHQQSSADQKLTPREAEILRFFAEGLTNPQIAEKLFISVRTVESHKNHIMQKFGLKSTVDLIKFALKSKIIQF